jgi:hypothetical protein
VWLVPCELLTCIPAKHGGLQAICKASKNSVLLICSPPSWHAASDSKKHAGSMTICHCLPAAGVMCAADMGDPSIGNKEKLVQLGIKLHRGRIPHYWNTAARSTFAGARGT